MTSRERVLRAINFEPADRVPIFDKFWAEFEQNARNELGIPHNVSINDYFDIDLSVNPPIEVPYPSMIKVISKTSNGEKISVDGWGRTSMQREGAYFRRELDYTVKKKKDLEDNPFECVDDDNRYSAFCNAVQRLKERNRCVFSKIGGLFRRSTYFCGEETLLCDIASNDDGLARELAERLGDFFVEITLQALERGSLWDTGTWIFDDIGCNKGSIISPKSFEQIYYPVYKRMISRLKAAGCKKVFLHSDGDIRQLLDMFIDAGIDGINPVEPRANMLLPELRAKYGKKLVLIGGICNSDILMNGPADRIIKHTDEILDVASDGGVIIGTHTIGPDIPVNNYLIYYNRVMERGNH